ncbi:MAG: TonB-dependent receptor plug [Segetibacter sp.]|nr:TonB-dependent receptor plug [Segetibacter sp.]
MKKSIAHIISTSILFAVIISFQTVHAQSKIYGLVVEGNNKPLFQANVLLLRSKDSALVKGIVAEASGSFSFNNIPAGKYLITSTFVGFKQVYTPAFTINHNLNNVDKGTITLLKEDKQLDKVTVTARRPLFEQRIDRTIMNVANSIIASGSTALEVLEKAPGVTVDRQNDQISLRGKEGIIVQIDGKQTFLPMADVVALLRSMPSDNIDRIELITNPSAKYDAAGNAGIIDIRLKKNNNIGTNGSVSVTGGSGRYDRERASMLINHRTSKINLFGNYSAYRGGTYWDFDITRKQTEGLQQNIIHSLSYIRMKDNGQNSKLGLDYFLSKSTTIGVVWTAFWSDFGERNPAHALFQRHENDAVYLHTLSNKTISTNSSNHLGNFNIQHSFVKKQAQLSADFDIARFRREYTNSLNTQTIIPSTPMEPPTGLYTQMPTSIDIVTFKTDYSQSINTNWKMEAGMKSSSVRTDNDVELKNGISGNLQKDTSLSNHFKYDELVNAAYINLSGQLAANTTLMAGLRAEHTHSVGNSVTLNNVVSRNYLNLFPSLFLSRTLNKQNTLTFSYSYRIDRPNYQSLNPARSYLDPYTYSSGNAFLKPQYTHSLELRHGYKEKIFTSLAASYVTDLQFFVIQPLDAVMTRRMPENIGKSEAYSLTLSFPVRVRSGWTMQGTLMGNYSIFDYTYKGSLLHVQQIAGRLNASNSFVFGKGWTGELAGWLSAPSVYALQKTPWLGSLDAGIQKSFLARWKAKFSVQDVLHTNKILFRIDAPGFTSRGSIGLDTRVAMLNLTYSFGNQQLKNSRQHKTGSDEEIQRTN